MKKKKLNLGCGPTWKVTHPDYEGLDMVDYGQLWVGDVKEVLTGMSDNSYHEVTANHFLEHLIQEDVLTVLSEVYRILIPGGLFKITVPHYSGEHAYSLMHKTFFSERTFKDLERGDLYNPIKFPKWNVKEVVTNDRPDIHAWLIKEKK